MVDKLLDGYNATVFAYGMTSSGKTYTMEGTGALDSRDSGLIPRVARAIFEQARARPTSRRYSVKCSYLQLYNERIHDLFSRGGYTTATNFHATALKMRWDKVQQFSVENLLVQECSDAEELVRRWQAARRQKMMGSNKLNSESSRSHTIFSIIVESHLTDTPLMVRTSRI